jgi:hypothetical protein
VALFGLSEMTDDDTRGWLRARVADEPLAGALHPAPANGYHPTGQDAGADEGDERESREAALRREQLEAEERGDRDR